MPPPPLPRSWVQVVGSRDISVINVTTSGIWCADCIIYKLDVSMAKLTVALNILYPPSDAQVVYAYVYRIPPLQVYLVR